MVRSNWPDFAELCDLNAVLLTVLRLTLSHYLVLCQLTPVLYYRIKRESGGSLCSSLVEGIGIMQLDLFFIRLCLRIALTQLTLICPCICISEAVLQIRSHSKEQKDEYHYHSSVFCTSIPRLAVHHKRSKQRLKAVALKCPLRPFFLSPAASRLGVINSSPYHLHYYCSVLRRPLIAPKSSSGTESWCQMASWNECL